MKRVHTARKEEPTVEDSSEQQDKFRLHALKGGFGVCDDVGPLWMLVPVEVQAVVTVV